MVPVTIQATVLSFLLALVLGLFLMLLRISRFRVISAPAGELIELIRGTPLLVQLFFLFFLLPQVGITLPPLTTGILGIGIYNAAPCAEVYRAGIQAVPAGQWEAAKALNLGTYRTWRDMIIPQSLSPIVPALGNYLIGIFKETPLLSFLAVGELMHASKLIGSEYYRFTEAVTLAGLFFLVMSLIAAVLVRMVDILPRRSPVVSGISAGEVLEISAIRLALEPLALAEAIPNMTGATVREGERLLEDYGKCSDPWDQVELNRRFHLLLYEPCGKKRLMKIISDQYDGMTRCAQVLVIRSSKLVDRSVAEHEGILSACEAKDLERATAMLRSHLQASNDRLHRQLVRA